MPKMKTKSGAAKRFKFTKNGKIKRKKSKLRHIMGCKTTKQKRHLRAAGYVSKADEKQIKQSMPYA
ncbi:50S ribosomal protein L35 [bacterium]|nr:50S ribosomal protein L35 [bacterium]